MAALARACALALLAAGCFVDVGLPGDTSPLPATATSSSSSPSASTTADATAGSTTAVTTGDGASTSTTTTTTGATTSDAICGVLGKPCSDADPCCGCLACTDGQCTGSDACGTCRSCSAIGACQPAEPGAPCTAPNDECMNTIWGVDGKSCLAAEYAIGKCDDDGACVAGGCDGMGAILATCINGACVDASTCAPGSPVDSLGAFCVEEGQTPECTTQCTDSAGLSTLTIRQCGPGGNCMNALEFDCGNFKCDGSQACKDECGSDGDCIAGATCFFGKCAGG
jgi:hypothetical protein